jgi:drug/metabolite transporter (DMT)-like permease
MADIYLFCGAIAFSFHIMTVDHFSPLVNGVKLSCIQFLTCGTICTICMFLFEEPTFANIKLAAVPILYTGIMSSGVAYTLQVVGQKSTPPTLATLLMSLESVFATIAGAVILHDRMSGKEYFGCILMLCAVVLAQLPEKKKVET